MTVLYYEKLKLLRKNKKINAVTFAERLNVSRRTLWLWETGKTIPNVKMIKNIAEKLSISVSEISTLTDPHPTSNELFPKIENYWKEIIDLNENKEEERFLELLHQINLQRKNLYRSSVIIKALLMSMNVMMYIKDAKLNFITANKSFLEMLSLPPELIVAGKNDSFFFSKEEAVLNSSSDENVLNTGTAMVKTEGYIPGTRKKKWGLISRTPIYNIKKEISGLIVTFIDITDRKHAEQMRELLDLNVNSMEDALTIWDVETGNYLYISKAKEKIFGYKDTDFFKGGFTFWLNCVHENDKGNEIIYRDTKNWPEKRFLKIKDRSGQIKWLESSTFNSTFQGRKCNISIEKDISGLKSLEEKKNLLQQLLDKCDDVVGVFDMTETKQLYLSKSIETLTGYSKDYFSNNVHLPLMKCMANENKAKIKKYADANKWPFKFETEITTNNGKVIYCEIKLYVDTSLNNKCMIWVARDISDKKHIEEIFNIMQLHVNASDTGIIIKNNEKIFYISDKIADILKCDIEELHTENFKEKWFTTYLHPDDSEAELSYFRKKEWPNERCYRIIRVDGEIRKIKSIITASKYFGEDCYACFLKDVTDYEKNEEIKQLLEINVNAMSEGIAITDIENRKILYLNRAIEKIYEYPLSNFYEIGVEFWLTKCVHPEDKALEKEYINSLYWPKKRRFRIISGTGKIKTIEDTYASNIVFKGQECRLFIESEINPKNDP